MDALVKSLIKDVSSNGVTDHFRGKGQKNFRAHYLEIWDQVRNAYEWELIIFPSAVLLRKVEATDNTCCAVQILRECQNADVLCDGFLLDKVVHLIIGLNW